MIVVLSVAWAAVPSARPPGGAREVPRAGSDVDATAPADAAAEVDACSLSLGNAGASEGGYDESTEYER